MRFFRALLASFAFATSALVSQGVLAEEAAAMPDGSIRFAGQPDGSYLPCGFTLTHGDHLFGREENTDCVNDRMNYFQLDTAPSATYITLYSDKHVKGAERWCQEKSGVDYGWKFKLKTYIHPVSTVWISIASLKSTAPADGENSGIVARGIILVSKDLKTGDQIDELSCVKVERSPLP